ncbi:MAG: HAMP domain-containing sensor histidine kinase, partial [Oscillospiraceae bacterium]
YSGVREQTFRFLLSTMTDNGKIHALICDSNGKIISSSDNDRQNIVGQTVQDAALKKIIGDSYYSGMGNLDNHYSGQNYTVGMPYYNSLGKFAGGVFVTTTVSDMHQLLFDILRMFLFSAALVFFLAAIVSFFTVRSMTRPLKLISTTARSFARGDFDKRVPVTSDDEIGELTCAFNNMADSIEKSEELRRTFVANVSHELRSPMTSISGFVDGIVDGTIPPERERQYLSIVSSEIRRLSRLVSRMLDITRLQAENMATDITTFDFCELTRRAILGFESRIGERGLQMNVSFSEYSINVSANEDAIFQVVYNLCENAIKFSSEGETIDISVDARSNLLRFSIRNRGAVISPDELPYIFDRFHKTDRSRASDKTGLGLGLYIVKMIVNQHKGDVNVTSADGETEFSFTLPLDIKPVR